MVQPLMMRLERRLAARDLERRLVWLMGSPRSGSTWLLRLLGTHPDVATIDEPLIGAHLGVRTDATAVSRHPFFSRPALADNQRDRPAYVFSDHYADVWRPALRRLVRDRFAAQTARRPWQRRPVVVVKEPHGSEAAPMLFGFLPGAFLLFLVRDGRDVADSTLDALVTGGWRGDPPPLGPVSPDARLALVADAARGWAVRVAAVRETYERMPPNRRLRVRYEDLRADPVPALLSIYDALGLAVNEADVRRAADRLAFERVPAERRGPGQFHRAARPGLWRENLSPSEQKVVVEVAGAELRALGYEPAG